jgi:hypothetical protein
MCRGPRNRAAIFLQRFSRRSGAESPTRQDSLGTPWRASSLGPELPRAGRSFPTQHLPLLDLPCRCRRFVRRPCRWRVHGWEATGSDHGRSKQTTEAAVSADRNLVFGDATKRDADRPASRVVVSTVAARTATRHGSSAASDDAFGQRTERVEFCERQHDGRRRRSIDKKSTAQRGGQDHGWRRKKKIERTL